MFKQLKRKKMEFYNFYLKGNLAYTKDYNVLIHNIFAYSIPERLELVDLQNYFQHFGGKAINLIGNRAAFIHFENAFMAASVLETDTHTVLDKNCCFFVKACDSFLQPYYDDKQYIPKNPKNITDLNDDVLIHLFKYLPIKEQLTLICLNKRFIPVFKMYAKLNLREIKQDHLENMSECEIRLLFVIAGEFLKTLALPIYKKPIDFKADIDLITVHCHNLQNLSINGHFGIRRKCNLGIKRFNNLLLSNQKLKILRLKNLSLNDNYIDAIKILPQIEQLSLISCSKVTGRSLNQLTQLKRLRLEYLNNLDVQYVEEALSVLKDLYAFSFHSTPDLNESLLFLDYLDDLENQNLEIIDLKMSGLDYNSIRKCTKLKSFYYHAESAEFDLDFFKLLKEHKFQLKTLILCETDRILEHHELNRIGQFKNLTKLHFPSQYLRYKDPHSIHINDAYLETLKFLNNLIELKLSGLHSFTNAGLLNLIKNCRKLKWVNVMYTSIDNNFVYDVINLIKRESRPNGCITFLVYKTRIDNKLLPKEYKSMEIQKLVNFVFDNVYNLNNYDNCEDTFENDGNLIDPPFFQ